MEIKNVWIVVFSILSEFLMVREAGNSVKRIMVANEVVYCDIGLTVLA